MINIANLSQDSATEDSAMDAITGGCCYHYRPRGMSYRRFKWLVRKGKIGFCRPRPCRPVCGRPVYRPLPFPVRGVVYT